MSNYTRARKESARPDSEDVPIPDAGLTEPETPITRQPRAEGRVRITTRAERDHTRLGTLYQQGSLKALFPHNSGEATRGLTGVLLNTAGGITGGDRFGIDAGAGPGCRFLLTTQAAERAYRAQPGEIGHLTTRLRAEAGARIDWLPQETILYEGSALNRRLEITLAADARALIVEPLVFGRVAMGEVLTRLQFTDRIDLHRDGDLVFADRTRLCGAVAPVLATAGAAGAMASVLLAAPDAGRFLSPARALMPHTGGVSLIRDGVLFVRLLAPDSFELRRSLIPLIEALGGGPLPRTWTI